MSSSSGNTSTNQFYTDELFRENLVFQTTMTPKTIEQLSKYGVLEDSELKLEYFFHTNSEEKAASLHGALDDLGYEGGYGESDDGDSLYIVNGWTVPIVMSEASVVGWTESMCYLGFKYDVKFDGWGTTPDSR